MVASRESRVASRWRVSQGRVTHSAAIARRLGRLCQNSATRDWRLGLSPRAAARSAGCQAPAASVAPRVAAAASRVAAAEVETEAAAHVEARPRMASASAQAQESANTPSALPRWSWLRQPRCPAPPARRHGSPRPGSRTPFESGAGRRAGSRCRPRRPLPSARQAECARRSRPLRRLRSVQRDARRRLVAPARREGLRPHLCSW